MSFFVLAKVVTLLGTKLQGAYLASRNKSTTSNIKSKPVKKDLQQIRAQHNIIEGKCTVCGCTEKAINSFGFNCKY